MYLFADSLNQPLWHHKYPPFFGYSVSVLCTLHAFLLTIQVSAIHSGTPFLFFLPASTVSTWYSDRGPGLATLGLTKLITTHWTQSAKYVRALTTCQLVQLAGFLVVIGVILGEVANLQRERASVLSQQEALRLALASIGDAVISDSPTPHRTAAVQR
jgi:hypothetical protein